jgi:RNA polymerase sigma-70 factor (ECF subfamily)
MSDISSASSRPSAQSDHSQQDARAERALIRRCQESEPGAFNELVQKYERVVYNFAYRLAGNYDDANDVAQEAFVRAYTAMTTFRSDAAFSTWLFRITTNVYLDARKRAKSRPSLSLDEFIEFEESRAERQVEDTGPNPNEILEAKERSEILERAIQTLPDYQRVMVVLYHVHQKSYEEIAQVMEMPIGTVKSRLNRARLALKEILSKSRELF